MIYQYDLEEQKQLRRKFLQNKFMKNITEMTKTEIINEVKRTGILHKHYFSRTTVELIDFYFDIDYKRFAAGGFLTEAHIIAFFKKLLEKMLEKSKVLSQNDKEFLQNDLEIINLVYKEPIKTLTVDDGYVELFENRSVMYYRQEFVNRNPHPEPDFVDAYVVKNIEIITDAHDKHYLNPESLTEAEQSEILIASLSSFKFQYEGNLRTISSIEEDHKGQRFLRTLTVKRARTTSQDIFRATLDKLNVKHFSVYGAKLLELVAAQNQYSDLNKFLQIQSALHLLERKILSLLKDLKVAEEVEHLKEDLLKIQAFKEASADIDQIILPDAEILVFSDRSVLYTSTGEESESHVDIYQFIMRDLRNLQSAHFSGKIDNFVVNPNSVAFHFEKYGVTFSIANGRVITKFTKKFKDRLFNAANVRLV